MWATKVDIRAWLAGALSCSGICLPSQKQCHIKRPAPYASRVSSSHAWIIVSLTRSRWDWSEAAGQEWVLWNGTHSLRRSLARQWGRRGDGAGVKLRGYGAGVSGVEDALWGIGSSRCLPSEGLRRLSSPCRGSVSVSSETVACPGRFNAAVLAGWARPDACEERMEFLRDADVIEEELAGGVASP